MRSRKPNSPCKAYSRRVKLEILDKGMVNHLEIDPALVQEAIQLGKHRTKEDAVNEARKKYIQRRK